MAHTGTSHLAATSPLRYLILIDKVDILRSLYQEIVLPGAVLQELLAIGTPEVVSNWIIHRPDWVIVPSEPTFSESPSKPEQWELDAGESAAIQIALENAGSLLLIDEAAGRAVASKLGLIHTGTLVLLCYRRRTQ